MLTRVAENITVAMSVDSSALHLVDQNEPAILYEAASYSAEGDGEPAGQRYPIDDHPLMAKLLQSGEALTLSSEQPPAETDPAIRALLDLFGYRSGLFLALRIKDRAVGLLSIG